MKHHSGDSGRGKVYSGVSPIPVLPRIREAVRGEAMADIAAIEAILHEIERTEGIQDAVLVSRSGMHIAGSIPKGAHSETFVAMFAILLGAAETATSELKERLDSVVINLEGSRVVIMNDGPKALFVFRMSKDVDPKRLRQNLDAFAKRSEEHL